MTYSDLAAEVGRITDEKNLAYGNSHAKTADFFRLLYPNGIAPEQYADALTLARMFDKMMRLATSPTAFDEDPWRDLAGYAILGIHRSRTAGSVRAITPDEDWARLQSQARTESAYQAQLRREIQESELADFLKPGRSVVLP